MQILTLKVSRLRALDDLVLDLRTASGEPRRRLILLGPNGCGKTTVLRAIAHLFGTFDDRLGARKMAPSDVRRVSSLGTVNAAYDADRLAAFKRFGLAVDDAATHGEIAMEVELTAEESASIRETVPQAPRRGWLRREVGGGNLGGEALDEDGFEDAAHAAIGSTQVAPCVLLSAARGTLTQPHQISLDAARFDSRENCLTEGPDRFVPLATLLALAHAAPDTYDRGGRLRRMWKAIERYLPLMPQAYAVDSLRLVLRNRAGVPVVLDELSDGERAVLLILADVALRHPAGGVVMIDEIEQHLHPRWQTELLDALLALEPTAQYIITTQADYVAASAPRDALRIADWGEAS